MEVFFVCGAPKSGTTWLQRILDAHPEIICSGEGHFIKHFAAPLARTMETYNRELETAAQQVYEGEPYYPPLAQADFDEMVRGFVLKRMSARANAQTRWIGDKTPGYTHHLPQLHRLFPQARFIHIVRDPRDVAVSRMAHSRRAGFAEALTAGTEQNRQTLEGAVRIWREAVTRVDAFAQEQPGLVHELRYLDLYDDPVAEIGRLLGFLGAPAPRVLVERMAAATSFRTLAGRPPGVEDLGSFLRKGLPGDWKTRLDAEGAQFVAESCGDLMRAKRFAA